MPDPQTTTEVQDSQIATLDDSSISYFITKIVNSYAIELQSQDFWNKLFSGGLNLLGSPTEAFKYGYSTKYMSGETAGVPLASIPGLRAAAKLSIVPLEGTNSKPPVSTYRYITLASLLAFINNSCLLYDKSNNDSKPAIYVDFNQNANFCLRIPQQFSVDPGVCLVDTDCTDADYNKLFTIKGLDIAKITGPSSPVNGKLASTLATIGAPYIDNTNPGRGKFMNVLVNTECIRTTLAENTDDDKNIFLSKFLSSLMKKIQVALGNINSFEVGYDETANTVYIYDAQLVDIDRKTQPIPALPVFGLGSTVRSFNLKTEASTRLGSMMAITARAGARNTGTNKDNAAFTALNQGLEDRLFVNTSPDPKKEPTEGAPTGSTAGLEVTANAFNTQIGKLYEITTTNISYDVASVESIQNYYTDAMLLLKGDAASGKIDSVAATGILPLALNMTLDGIGGIPLFQAFTIPANRLPAQYVKNGKPRVGFTVAGVSHTIENNQWTTQIRGLMINIPDERRVYTPGYTAPKKRIESPVTGGSGGGVGGGSGGGVGGGTGGSGTAGDGGGGSGTAGTSGVTDFEMFYYLAWQQGVGGAAQHYSLWKGNGKYTRYTIKVKDIKGNWPGGYKSSKGYGAADVQQLYNTDQRALAEAFVDVQKQLYAKKAAAAASYFQSNGKNRTGVSYSTIKAAAEKHARPSEGLTAAALTTIAMIENGLNTDTASGGTFQTMYQMNKTYKEYQAIIGKQTQTGGHKTNFVDYSNVEELVAGVVPELIKGFTQFRRFSGFTS